MLIVDERCNDEGSSGLRAELGLLSLEDNPRADQFEEMDRAEFGTVDNVESGKDRAEFGNESTASSDELRADVFVIADDGGDKVTPLLCVSGGGFAGSFKDGIGIFGAGCRG